jgi:hypothetical protein
MSRPCRICTDQDRPAIDAALLGGVPDRTVADRFRLPHSSVQRHRVNHLVRPAQDRLAIIARDSEEKRQRQELAQAAMADEPSVQAQVEAALGTRALLKKLVSIEDRLERMNARAEEAGSPTGVAALAGQQIRSLEFGAKLAGNPNFRPPSALPQASDKATVSIEILFANAGKREEIALAGRPVIDGDKIDPAAIDDENLPKPHANMKLQPDAEGKVAGGYWDFTKLRRGGDEDGDEKE